MHHKGVSMMKTQPDAENTSQKTEFDYYTALYQAALHHFFQP